MTTRKRRASPEGYAKGRQPRAQQEATVAWPAAAVTQSVDAGLLLWFDGLLDTWVLREARGEMAKTAANPARLLRLRLEECTCIGPVRTLYATSQGNDPLHAWLGAWETHRSACDDCPNPRPSKALEAACTTAEENWGDGSRQYRRVRLHDILSKLPTDTAWEKLWRLLWAAKQAAVTEALTIGERRWAQRTIGEPRKPGERDRLIKTARKGVLALRDHDKKVLAAGTLQGRPLNMRSPFEVFAEYDRFLRFLEKDTVLIDRPPVRGPAGPPRRQSWAAALLQGLSHLGVPVGLQAWLADAVGLSP